MGTERVVDEGGRDMSTSLGLVLVAMANICGRILACYVNGELQHSYVLLTDLQPRCQFEGELVCDLALGSDLEYVERVDSTILPCTPPLVE